VIRSDSVSCAVGVAVDDPEAVGGGVMDVVTESRSVTVSLMVLVSEKDSTPVLV